MRCDTSRPPTGAIADSAQAGGEMEGAEGRGWCEVYGGIVDNDKMWYRGYFWIALALGVRDWFDGISGSVLCLDWDVVARGSGWVDASSYYGTLTAHAESPFSSIDYRTLP
ncbi:hypothetical protein VC83_08687 [Pseudogymnoascus destructans]|uniref:Uncharacterized protein n=2 Tax=Pseudogymnoascus destructans TaxID=655981 RepID=L8FSJ3_PSED2|nr:uncharacterized protein VC83_08687 [Pseudogymnoascus destructans]ELR02666.1 hypothetical protein GMDG_05620 [Pseudogymnoascus destructans 20631-21]OAF54836.1 hypothetical protein VC83_08687 [Pseudogymnoascus destructans]